MSFPDCAKVYTHAEATVNAIGLTVTATQFNDVIEKFAIPILFDESGMDVLKRALDGVVETDFERANLEVALKEATSPQSWEVGEAIGQAVVTNLHACIFPWPIRRDQRNPAANQPGSDLVGFQDTGAEYRKYRFAFGEVKT